MVLLRMSRCLTLPLLLAVLTVCYAKDRDCDVPDSYHATAGTSTKCEMQLNLLADSLANISRCMIMAARPLTPCLSCFPMREGLERAYVAIMGSGADQPQPACAHELLDRDQTHMMLRAYTYYSDLIAISHCDRCLQRHDNGTYTLLDEVVQFRETDAAFRRCMQVEFPQHLSVNSSASMCDFCRPQYDLEQRHAKAVIKDVKHWQTCRDIIDMANTTQYMWQHHGCDVWVLTPARFLYSLLPLAAAAVLIVTFYCYAWRRHAGLERAAAAARAERRAGAEPEAAPQLSRRRHLYDYSGLRRRPNAAAARQHEEEREEEVAGGESDSSSETETDTGAGDE